MAQRKQFNPNRTIVRITNKQLADTEKQDLLRIAKQYKIDDKGLLYDLYSILCDPRTLVPLKRQELFCRSLAVKEGPEYTAEFRYSVERRRKFIQEFIGNPMFKAVIGTVDPMEATERMIAIFRQMHKENPNFTCAVCQFKDDCEVGQAVVRGRTSGLDTLELHPECPSPPFGHSKSPLVPDIIKQGTTVLKIIKLIIDNEAFQSAIVGGGHSVEADAQQAVAAIIVALEQAGVNAAARTEDGDVADEELNETLGEGEATGGGAGKTGGVFDATFTGKNLFGAVERLVKQIDVDQLTLFKTMERLSLELEDDQGKKMSPTAGASNAHSIKKMDEFSEVVRILPSELAKPAAQRSLELATKKVLVRKPMKTRRKTKVLGVTVDCSGSMDAPLGGGNSLGILKRCELASLLSLALVNYMMKNDGVMVFAFFADGVDNPTVCKTKEDYLAVSRKIGLGNYNGGGTCIKKAIVRMTGEVNKLGKQEKVKAKDLILITDADDNLTNTQAEIQSAIDSNSGSLHTLQCSNTNSSADRVLGQLGEFVKVNPATLDLGKIASIAKCVTQQDAQDTTH